MIDWELRDQIIEGLAACLPETDEDAAIGCEGCPYGCSKADAVRVPVTLLEDVRAMLKTLKPRVMTATEAYTADYVYIEFDGVITPAIRTTNERDGHRESYFATQQLGGDWMRWDDYGITWRCWTSRPDEKTREAEAWT